jgi:hypothetical protein
VPTMGGPAGLTFNSAMMRAYTALLSGVPYCPNRMSRRTPFRLRVTTAWPDCLWRR